MNTLRQILVASKFGDEGCSESELYEVFTECVGEVIHFGDTEDYRWRVDQEVVVKVVDGGVDRFFMHTICHYSGENSPEDAGFIPTPIDDIAEVVPKQVMTTTYVYK